MQLENHKEIQIDGTKLKISIILPYFNEKMGMELLANTEEELMRNGVKAEHIDTIRVAGALEIPFAAQKIAETVKPDAIIALGIVIRGETTHYDHVVETTHQGLMKVQLDSKTPIAFGILACENQKQAQERVDKNGLNKGKGAAIAALIQTQL